MATVTGDGTDSLVSERVTNNEIAGITPPQGARADQKRQPEDPIYVNLVSAILDSRIRQGEKPKGALGQHLRHEFAADPIIQLLPEPKNKIGRKTPGLSHPQLTWKWSLPSHSRRSSESEARQASQARR